jgi:putative ABC transport system permease protein
MLAVIPLAPPDGRLPLALFVSLPLVVAAAMLGPVLVVPLSAVVTAPVSRFSVAGGLARRNLKAAVRRTASVAAPVLVLIGVAGSLLAGTEVLASADRQDARLLYTADLVDVPADATPLSAVRAVPGVAAASRVATSQLQAQVNRTSRAQVALGVDPDAAGQVLGLGHVEGNLSGLHGAAVALGRAAAAGYRLHLGDDLRVRLADGSDARLRVVALFTGTPLSSPVLLPYDLVAAHRPAGWPQQPEPIHVRLAPGAAAGPVADQLTRAGGTVSDMHQFLAHLSGARAAGMRIGALVLAVFALAYTFIAVANTTVMSFADRHREFVRLRVVGASRAQLLRMALWEALASAVTGLAFGAGVATVSTGGLWAVLRGIGLAIPLTVPWFRLATIAAAAVAVVLAAAAAPVAALLRRGYHAADVSA